MRCSRLLRRSAPLVSSLRGVVMLAWGVLALGVVPHAGAASSSAAPQYGEALFHYFRGDDFSALTQWMIAQREQRTAPQGEEFDLLRIDMLTRYGMDREAGEILAQLGDRGAVSDARDQAWFKLAKMRYQKGQWSLAEEALARVRRPLAASLENERQLLLAQLLMARFDYRAAAQVLKAVSDQSPDARIARYNLGVAQIKGGNRAEGLATLDALGTEPADTDEQRTLRDRANVALGYAALQAQQPESARRYLERVPLQGAASNKALLGYGWAAMDQQAPQAALVPWLALTKRDAHDVAALEAKIAVPYAYAQLNAKGKALQHYAEAITVLEREQIGLDAAIESVRVGPWIEALLAQGAGALDVLPNVPHSERLAGLWSQPGFHEAFKSLRELRGLSQNLQSWRSKIDALKATLIERRQTLAQYQQQFSAHRSAQSMEALRQRIDASDADLAQGEARMDGVVFADAHQGDLLARMEHVQAVINKLNAVPDIGQARDRARLLGGLLSWQLAQDTPARLEQTKQALASTKDELAQAQRHDAAIVQVMREASQRLGRLDERVQALTGQLDAMIPAVAALGAEQQAVIQDMAVAELMRQKESVGAYLAQARFGVAKLYDQAAAAGRSDQKEAADASQP